MKYKTPSLESEKRAGHLYVLLERGRRSGERSHPPVLKVSVCVCAWMRKQFIKKEGRSSKKEKI